MRLVETFFTRTGYGMSCELVLQTDGFFRPALLLRRDMELSEVAHKLRTLADQLDAADTASDAIQNAKGPKPSLGGEARSLTLQAQIDWIVFKHLSGATS